MKTGVIYNAFDDGLKFLIMDGDWSRFDGIYIGLVANQEQQEELTTKLFEEIDSLDEIDYQTPQNWYENLKHQNVTKIIQCGFIP